ncbi:MAG: 2-hydroxyacid dehydrogenase [Thermoanaerobaculia bacterium]
MSLGQVFVTRRIPDSGMKILEDAGADVTVFQRDEEQGLTREDVLAGVRSCDVLLPLLTEAIDHQVMSANDRLLGIAQMAVGFNNIDVEVATELGLPVTNTPGVLTDTTADLTWALLMAVARNLPQSHNYMVAGRYRIWGPNLFTGADISPGGSGERKVLGVIGYGRIGSAVAKRSMGFDMRVLAYDPFNKEGVESDPLAEWAELDELLERSDFVSLHPLLTPDTHHLIGETELRKMKPTAYLVNAARGPVIDEKALVNALQEGWIAGAGLDVYENEPAMAEGLAELDNAVLLPHIASASIDTRGKMASMAATNAVAHLRREPAPNVVNPEVYESEAYRERMARA